MNSFKRSLWLLCGDYIVGKQAVSLTRKASQKLDLLEMRLRLGSGTIEGEEMLDTFWR